MSQKRGEDPAKELKMKLTMIDTARIYPNPMQPRRTFDPDRLAELAESIRENGLLQPVSVRKTGDGYQLVAGERRLRASIMAGLKRIPCVTVKAGEDESGVLALVENLQRQDLDFFEEAAAISALMSKNGLTQGGVALALGKAQSTVANKLRLLCYDEVTRARMLKAELTERHARALLAVPAERRSEAVTRVIERRLNVAQTEALAQKYQEEMPCPRRQKGVMRDLRMFDNSLKKSVELLRSCGMAPKVSKRTAEGYTEYIIRVPDAGQEK